MSQSATASYVTIKLSNNSGYQKEIYVFVQSENQIYSIDQSSFIASVKSNPKDGDAPSITLSELTNNNNEFYLDATQPLTSGRVYFSTDKSAVQIKGQEIEGPSPTSDFSFDFIELTIFKNEKTGKQCINLDTTQIDQFGMPINIQVTPSDPNYPKGTGIVKKYKDGSAVTKATVISNFKKLTQKTGFAPYADCIKTSTSRLLGPQHAINEKLPQMQYWAMELKANKNSATAKITGTWGDKTPKKYPIPSKLQEGMRVSGQGIPAGATVTAVKAAPSDSSSPYEVTLGCPEGSNFTTRRGAYLSFFPSISGGLSEAFDDAVYNLFNSYSGGKELYICANGTNSGMEIYKGTVITNYQLPEGITDMNGGTETNYTVFKFTGTGKKYNDADNTLSDTTEKGDYVVFYPYFNTNCEQSPKNNALTSDGPPPPPQWFEPNFDPAKGNMNFVAPASLMVFACNGVFADSVYQNKAFAATSTGLVDDTVLGNIENQLVTMLNRGIGLPDNFEPRIGYVLFSDLGPVDPSNPTPTSQTYHGTTGINGATTNYDLPGASPTAPGIIKDSISVTITLEDGNTQKFRVSKGSFTLDKASPDGTTCAYVKTIIFDPPTQSAKIQLQWTVPPENGIEVKFDYSYGTKLSHKYATLNLISPYIKDTPLYKSGDFGPATNFSNNIKKGMQMTTMAQFSIPMTVYYAAENSDTIIIESSVELQPFNTGILCFADFFPTKQSAPGEKEPDGTWNGYAYYFHQGDLGSKIPTIDGRGYAFPFDDNGGYSSDLTVVLDTSSENAATVNVDLLPWED